MNGLRSKLPHVGTTIFTVMSQMAAENKAINLSQGFPDFDCDKRLKKLVNHYIKSGYNQYAPMAGLRELRQVLCKKIEKLYGRHYNPENEITVTAGATQGVFTAISALIRPGDEVITFSPAYDCYEPAITLNGGITKEIPLKLPNYSLDFKAIKNAINKKTKVIILNSPHNPTGSILSAEELEELAKVIRSTDIIILSDEVYEHIVFDNKVHQSIALFPTLAERSLIISSFGKTYHNTGWKMGYCYGPEKLMNEFRKVHQFNVFCVNRPYQHAFADFLKDDKSFLDLARFYQKKRDFFLKKIKKSRFKALPCHGTYFQLLDYSDISTLSEMEMAKTLCIDAGVASIPVSAFYQKPPESKVLRFCFAKDKSTISDGAEILCSL